MRSLSAKIAGSWSLLKMNLLMPRLSMSFFRTAQFGGDGRNLNSRIFIDMCSVDLVKFFKVNKLNLNFDYFKIPSVSNIMKNQSLKREAWVQLKLLKAKLNEF